MSSGGGTTKETTRTAPWAFMEPYISTGYQEAARMFSQGPEQYTPWSQVADLTDAQKSALSGVENYVQSPEVQQAIAGQQGVVRGLMAGGNNPYAGLASSAQSLMSQRLRDQTMDPSQGINRLMYQGTNDPALQAAIANSQNASLGQSRQVQSLLQNPLASSVIEKARGATQANLLANTLGTVYDTQNQQRLRAGELANTIQQNRANIAGNMLNAANQYGTQATGLGLQYAQQSLNTPYALLGELSNAGNKLQAANQAQLTDATNRWNFDQNAAYNNLVRYRNLINPNPQWGVTQSTTTTPGNMGGIASMIGAVGGGVAGGLMGGPAGAMMGANAGSALGGGIGKSFS